MAGNTTVIDEHIKEEASVVLTFMGLAVSDVFRMLLIRIESLTPNQKTIDVMEEAN